MFDMKSQRFGIEVEMTGLTRQKAAEVIAAAINGRYSYVGGSYRAYKVTDTFNRKWKIVNDSSITTSGYDEAVELVSPILYYDKMKTLGKILVALKAAGAIVNESCGIHIHVDAANHNVKSLKNLVKLFAKREDLIEKILKIHSRRLSYCSKTDSYLTRNIHKAKDMDSLAELWYGGDEYHIESEKRNHYSSTRYRMLNLHNVWFRGTVEFRMFNSSLDVDVVTSYIQFALAISARAINIKSVKSSRLYYDTDKKETSQWLTRLGLTGQEYKICRKTLLRAVA